MGKAVRRGAGIHNRNISDAAGIQSHKMDFTYADEAAFLAAKSAKGFYPAVPEYGDMYFDESDGELKAADIAGVFQPVGDTGPDLLERKVVLNATAFASAYVGTAPVQGMGYLLVPNTAPGTLIWFSDMIVAVRQSTTPWTGSFDMGVFYGGLGIVVPTISPLTSLSTLLDENMLDAQAELMTITGPNPGITYFPPLPFPRELRLQTWGPAPPGGGDLTSSLHITVQYKVFTPFLI